MKQCVYNIAGSPLGSVTGTRVLVLRAFRLVLEPLLREPLSTKMCIFVCGFVYVCASLCLWSIITSLEWLNGIMISRSFCSLQYLELFFILMLCTSHTYYSILFSTAPFLDKYSSFMDFPMTKIEINALEDWDELHLNRTSKEAEIAWRKLLIKSKEPWWWFSRLMFYLQNKLQCQNKLQKSVLEKLEDRIKNKHGEKEKGERKRLVYLLKLYPIFCSGAEDGIRSVPLPIFLHSNNLVR